MRAPAVDAWNPRPNTSFRDGRFGDRQVIPKPETGGGRRGSSPPGCWMCSIHGAGGPRRDQNSRNVDTFVLGQDCGRRRLRAGPPERGGARRLPEGGWRLRGPFYHGDYLLFNRNRTFPRGSSVVRVFFVLPTLHCKVRLGHSGSKRSLALGEQTPDSAGLARWRLETPAAQPGRRRSQRAPSSVAALGGLRSGTGGFRPADSVLGADQSLKRRKRKTQHAV